MASIAWHLKRQITDDGEARLFEGSDGYMAGEQLRDFVYVDDVVDVNLCFMEHRVCSGIFNVGTGNASTFNEVANAVIDWHGKGEISYISFPSALKDSYQSFTEADISSLRAAGYESVFADATSGVKAYLDRLDEVK